MKTRIEDEIMNMVSGGKVNTNTPDPGKLNIDKIINDPFYDWVADKIVEGLNKDDPNSSYNTRSREVNNNVDIYDFQI